MSNSIAFNESFDRFEALFEQIAEKDRKTTSGLKIVEEAEKLAATVINAAEATSEDCWARMWDKPLYAHIHTRVASGWCNKSAGYLAGIGTWKGMDKSSGQFRIDKKVGRGRSPLNFMAVGGTASALVDMDVPIERIYSIVCGAEGLRKLVGRNPKPMTDVIVDVETVRSLSDDLGYGWGTVTTLHYLTDMGLACKPDMHLNATCRHLGFEMDDVEAPSIQQAVEIVNFVKSLVAKKFGEASPYALRLVDKCLMEASKQQVIPVMSRFPKDAWWLVVELKVLNDNSDDEVDYRWKVDCVTIDQGKSKDPEGILRSDLRAIEEISKGKQISSNKSAKKIDVYKRILSGRSAAKNITFVTS